MTEKTYFEAKQLGRGLETARHTDRSIQKVLYGTTIESWTISVYWHFYDQTWYASKVRDKHYVKQFTNLHDALMQAHKWGY